MKELKETDDNVLLQGYKDDIYYLDDNIQEGNISNTDVYKYFVCSYTTDTGSYNNAAKEIGIINRADPSLKVQLIQNGIRGEFSVKIDGKVVSPAKCSKYLVKQEYDQYLAYMIFSSSCFVDLNYGEHTIECLCNSFNGYTYSDYMIVYISAEGELERDEEDIHNVVRKISSGEGVISDYELLYITSVNETNLEDVNWYITNNDSSKVSMIETNVYKILNALKNINNGTRGLNYYKELGISTVAVKNSKDVKSAIISARDNESRDLTRLEIIQVIEDVLHN